MKGLGCLTLIAIIVAGILLLGGNEPADVQNGQWIGEKAHRGWSRIQKLMQGAKQGWDANEPLAGPQQPPPAAPPAARPRPDAMMRPQL